MAKTKITNKTSQGLVSFLASLGLIRYKLKELLYDNKLYISTDMKYKAVSVEWKKIDSKGDILLSIKFNKLSTKGIDDKLKDIGGVVESKLNSELLNRIETKKYIEYILLLKRKEEQAVNLFDIDEIKNKNTKLRLNKHYEIDLLRTPGIAIIGRSGSGKSNLLFYILRELISNVTDRKYINVIDCKFDELNEMGRRLRLPTANKFEHIEKMLKNVHEEFKRRIKVNNHNKRIGKKNNFKPLVILFDEYGAYKNNLEKKQAQEIDKIMKDIAMMGRSLKVYIILALQRAEADVLNSSVRANFGTRIALGTIDDDSFRMLFSGERFSHIEKSVGEGIIEIDGHISSFKSVYCDFNFMS